MKFIESSTVELKSIINNDFKKEIVAFSNTNGGEIYVGVDKDGQVIGVNNIEQEMERISHIIHDGIHPDLIPFTSIESQNIEGKNIIHVSVSRGGRPPYHLSDKGLKPSGVYIRHGVTAVPASEEMIRDMIRESDGLTFDKARSLNQDLTFEYASRYFKERNVLFKEENMRTLGLIEKDGYYTNAALLLSDQCEHSMKCAVFEGEGKTIFKTRKEFYGSILKQLEEVYEFINLQNNVHVDFVGLQRIEDYDYPNFAIREALLNAIVHRDYNYSGSIIVNIFSNRIEFVSIGGLVKGITVQDIMNGVSQSRNTTLANIFYRLKLIESYGTGIQRIIESYQGHLQVQPKFLVEASSFVTVIPNSYCRSHIIKEKPLYNDNENRVLELLHYQDEITRKDVQELLKCSEFPVRKILKSLLEKDLISTIGKGRATKYKLNKK